jgi:hypothetical protein
VVAARTLKSAEERLPNFKAEGIDVFPVKLVTDAKESLNWLDKYLGPVK